MHGIVGVASSTAQSVAMARAVLVRDGLLDDRYAEAMLRLPWRALAGALRLRVLRSRAEGPTFAYLAARTLEVDGEVRRAIDEGVARVVIVGAGYDSRAWRLARPGVEFVELDHPSTQRDKRRRAPPSGPRYVEVDLAQEPVPDEVVDGCPTLSVVEGVTMYLAEPEVVRLLAGLRGPGNRLVVTFGVGGASDRSGRTVRASASAGGERFRYQPDADEAVALLERIGGEVRDLATGREIAHRHLTGTDLATDLTERAFVVSARCPLAPEGRASLRRRREAGRRGGRASLVWVLCEPARHPPGDARRRGPVAQSGLPEGVWHRTRSL